MTMNWAQIYEPLVDQKMSALVWMPMTFDTPGLVEKLQSPSISFTGGAVLAFEGGSELFLTWKQVGQQTVLWAADESSWEPHSLNRVRASPDGPWGEVEGATLRRAEFFTTSFVEDELIVGVRHTLSQADADIHLWIGTGGDDFIGDMDDLWVSAGIEPPNFADLRPVGAVGRQQDGRGWSPGTALTP